MTLISEKDRYSLVMAPSGTEKPSFAFSFCRDGKELALLGYSILDKAIWLTKKQSLTNEDKRVLFYTVKKMLKNLGKKVRAWVEEPENSRQKYLIYLGFEFKKRKHGYNKYVWLNQ